jgi:hypothetical protein
MKLPIRIHPRRFDAMHYADVEFMQSTDVVVVDMRRGRDYGTLNKVDDCSAQRGNTRTGVDDQIAIAAAHVPDVATQECIDVRLAEPGHAVRQRTPLEPSLRDFQRRHLSRSGFRVLRASSRTRIHPRAKVGAHSIQLTSNHATTKSGTRLQSLPNPSQTVDAAIAGAARSLALTRDLSDESAPAGNRTRT